MAHVINIHMWDNTLRGGCAPFSRRAMPNHLPSLFDYGQVLTELMQKQYWLLQCSRISTASLMERWGLSQQKVPVAKAATEYSVKDTWVLTSEHSCPKNSGIWIHWEITVAGTGPESFHTLVECRDPSGWKVLDYRLLWTHVRAPQFPENTDLFLNSSSSGQMNHMISPKSFF